MSAPAVEGPGRAQMHALDGAHSGGYSATNGAVVDHTMAYLISTYVPPFNDNDNDNDNNMVLPSINLSKNNIENGPNFTRWANGAVKRGGVNRTNGHSPGPAD